MVVPEHIQRSQDNVPVVVAAADKGEGERSGVIYINADIEEVLSKPEGTEKDPSSFPLDEEIDKDAEGDNELHQRAAPDPDHLAEDRKEEMAEFMKGQIHMVEKKKFT